MTPSSRDIGEAELRQSLERLLHADFSELQENIKNLQEQLQRLQSLSEPLPGNINQVSETLQNLIKTTGVIEKQVTRVQNDLSEPQKVADIVNLGLELSLKEKVDEDPHHFGEIIAPVISPAITNQIRNARSEMVAALYPIIGQTITKAISEAMQDLRRRVDANLKHSMDLRQRLTHLRGRLKGVSEADLILRDSLGYKITQVFLIHRETGLLLKQVPSADEIEDMDIFSAMLTAIRDFARDTFGSKEEDLEEIQYGDSHILLKNGTYAYVAVVVEGVQPPGYSVLIQNVIHEINVKYENELRLFSGEMNRLPDFERDLLPLLNPDSEKLAALHPESTLSRDQKILIGWGITGILLILALSVFACVFSVRLMPVAFPPPTGTYTPSPTRTLSPTPTSTATLTPSPTVTSSPTATPKPMITSFPPYQGVMNGNVWVRLKPEQHAQVNPVVVRIYTIVEIKAIYGEWAKINWTTNFGVEEGWVLTKYITFTQPTPARLVTPIK
jgi:hypothetical protein